LSGFLGFHGQTWDRGHLVRFWAHVILGFPWAIMGLNTSMYNFGVFIGKG